MCCQACAKYAIVVTYGCVSGVIMQIEYMPVAGESFGKRQARIKKLKPGNIVILKREKNNQHDSNAICLYTTHGDIGYIPRDRNQSLAKHLDGGGNLHAWVRQVTGGTKGKPDRGVVISVSDDEKYINTLLQELIDQGMPLENIHVPGKPEPLWQTAIYYGLAAVALYYIFSWLF